MNCRTHASVLALTLLLSTGLFTAWPSPSAIAADAATVARHKQAYDNRLASIRALSDALRMDLAKPGVKEALAKVDARNKEAEELAAAGEYEVARAILDEGYGTLTTTLSQVKNAAGQGSMSGMSGMADPGSAERNQRAGVERDIASTRSLVDALKLQNAQKNAGKGADIARIEADATQAQSLLAAGRVGEADKLIDDAYARAKSALAALNPASPQTVMSGMAGMADPGSAEANLRAGVERDIASARSLLGALKAQNAQKNAGKGTEIAKIEADTAQAQSLLAAGRVSEADQLIDDVNRRSGLALASMQSSDGLKTGSAALDATHGMSGMSAGQKRSEIDTRLKSTAVLRNALKSRNPTSEAIPRSEHLASEAGRLAASNPDRAMALADEAYGLVKAAMTRSNN